MGPRSLSSQVWSQGQEAESASPQQQLGETGASSVLVQRAAALAWLPAWSPRLPAAEGGRMELRGVLAKEGRGV